MKDIRKIMTLLFVVSCTTRVPLTPPATASSNSTIGAFQAAIEENNRDVVASMLQANPDLIHASLQSTSKTGQTFTIKALHLAAKRGHVGLIALLLHSGAPVDELDEREHTPLQYAAHNRQTAAIHSLLQAGADINIHQDNKDRLTPLQEAYTVYKDRPAHWEVFTLLLTAGADPNMPDKYRRTLLHWAAEDGQAAVVRHLVSHGADITCTDVNKETAAEIAARKGHGAIQQFLSDPMHTIRHRVMAMLKREATDPSDPTQEMAELISQLRSQPEGANSRIQIDEHAQTTWLHLVIAFEGLREDRKIALVRQLINAGANPNAKDSQEQSTPLHIAVKQGLIDLVRYLVEAAEVFIDEKDAAGYAPLYYAKLHEHAQIRGILEAEQERRRDPGHANNKMIVLTKMLEGDDYMLLREMLQNNQIHIDEIIEKKRLSRPLLHWACCEGKEKLVAELLYGRAEQRVDNMHDLLGIERLAVSSELVDIESPDVTGFSPLHYAARGGHLSIVKLLVEYREFREYKEIREANSTEPVHSPRYTDYVSNIVDYVTKRTSPEVGHQTALQLAKANKQDQVRVYLQGIQKGARYYCLACVGCCPCAKVNFSIPVVGGGAGVEVDREADRLPRGWRYNKDRVWSSIRPERARRLSAAGS